MQGQVHWPSQSAQLATGRRPIVLVGDAGFLAAAGDLAACAAAGTDPIVVVLNSGRAESPARMSGWYHQHPHRMTL